MSNDDGVGGAADAANAKVFESMVKILELPRLTMVPEIVSAGSPADSIVPAMEKADGLGVIVWPAMMRGEAGGRVESEFERV